MGADVRPRFRAPVFDPRESKWVVVVLRPLIKGGLHRSLHWYRNRSDAWSFIEISCSEIRGEVVP